MRGVQPAKYIPVTQDQMQARLHVVTECEKHPKATAMDRLYAVIARERYRDLVEREVARVEVPTELYESAYLCANFPPPIPEDGYMLFGVKVVKAVVGGG